MGCLCIYLHLVIYLYKYLSANYFECGLSIYFCMFKSCIIYFTYGEEKVLNERSV